MKRNVCLMLLVPSMFLWLSAAEMARGASAKAKPVLLVIDIQNAYLPSMDEKDKKPAMEMINYYIALFRANGFPVIRVYHTDLKTGPKPGSEEFEFPKTVAIQDSDPKVVKNYGNAFKKTDLDALLKARGCNTLFLCGLSAVGCVLATYHGATDLDYDVFMIDDAIISPDSSLTKAVKEISKTIGYYPLKLLLESLRQ